MLQPISICSKPLSMCLLLTAKACWHYLPSRLTQCNAYFLDMKTVSRVPPGPREGLGQKPSDAAIYVYVHPLTSQSLDSYTFELT